MITNKHAKTTLFRCDFLKNNINNCNIKSRSGKFNHIMIMI